MTNCLWCYPALCVIIPAASKTSYKDKSRIALATLYGSIDCTGGAIVSSNYHRSLAYLCANPQPPILHNTITGGVQ